MFLERFKQACSFKPNLYSIDAGILYNNIIGDIDHYIFKNININNQKYILYSKCKILENTLNSVGEYVKINTKYPKIVNKLTWPGLYFTVGRYELPTYLTTMFVVKTIHILQYLNKNIQETEVIIAIQGEFLIILNEYERLVDKPILLSDIWENVTSISSALMYNNKDKNNFNIFVEDTYYNVQYPYFGTYNNVSNIHTPLKITKKKRQIKDSIIWNVNMNNNCYNIDAIFPIYKPKSNNPVLYYIFQNNKYIRYNLDSSKIDVNISDITTTFYFLLYQQLVYDLINTEYKIDAEQSDKYMELIHKDVYNIESVITDLCKYKIKLYKKTKKKKHLKVVLQKHISPKEQLIIQYTNSIDSHSSIKIKQAGKEDRCDINKKGKCINFYNCSKSSKCKNMMIEKTYTYEDSNNVVLDISKEFKLEKVLYTETYPKTIKESFKNILVGEHNNHLEPSTIYENLLMVSNNIYVDSCTMFDNKLFIYKNFSGIDNIAGIKYINGTIDENKFNVSCKFDRTPKYLHKVSLLIENEPATSENNNGEIYEIYSICIKFENIYYIFGTILNSDTIRVIEYDMEKQQQVSKYALFVKQKWNIFSKEDFVDIQTVVNLDPLNNLNNTEPILCFLYNTPKDKSKLMTTSNHINSCSDINSSLCNKYVSINPKLKKLVNIFININIIKKLNKVTSIIFDGNLLYLFKTDITSIYQNVEELNKVDDEFLQLKTTVDNIYDAININFNQNTNKCITEPEIRQNIQSPLEIKKVMTELPTYIRSQKKKRKESMFSYFTSSKKSKTVEKLQDPTLYDDISEESIESCKCTNITKYILFVMTIIYILGFNRMKKK